MFIRIVAKEHSIMFECDRVVETDTFLQFMQGSEIFHQLVYAEEEWMHVYAMNDNGQTVDSWTINPESK